MEYSKTKASRSSRQKPAELDPAQFGVSFSLKQCRNFGLDWEDTLKFLIDEVGFRRFRLMSYWDEHEPTENKHDFGPLDRQLKLIQSKGGVISLCLGVRQPRWPENHWPDWALKLPKKRRDQKLTEFIKKVVERYKDNDVIVEWQLENEALLKSFGHQGDFDRKRLHREYRLVKSLDQSRPIIMSTSTSWGIPIRQPIPDIVGFSYYRTVFNKGKYRNSLFYPWIFRLRASLIKLIHGKPAFIHELQAEPWGPSNIWEMTKQEQDESMSIERLAENIRMAASTKLSPIDLWGGEWWYWRKIKANDQILYETVHQNIAMTKTKLN